MSRPTFAQFSWSVAGVRSKPIPLSGMTLCGFFLPAIFASTSVSFEVSDLLEGPYVPLKDETGVAISYTVAINTYCRTKPSDFAGVGFIRMLSGSSEVANTNVKGALREIA